MKKSIFSLLLFIIFSTCFAQKMKVLEGSFDNIKHINRYEVVFDYGDLQIHKNGSEENYIKENSFGNESFKKKWFKDRRENYEPEFIISFNKRFDNEEIVISQNTNSKYLIKIHTTKIYPGRTKALSGKHSKIDGNIIIYKRGEPENILFKYTFNNVATNGAWTPIPRDLGDRITQSYSVLGREFAEDIIKIYEFDPSFISELSEKEIVEMGGFSDVKKINNNVQNKETNDVIKCDVIYLRDESEIKSKIIEITEDAVKYKKQEHLDGPTRNVLVKDVFMIIYKNGTREVFKLSNE